MGGGKGSTISFPHRNIDLKYQFFKYMGGELYGNIILFLPVSSAT
jgi:hypothetical protein